MQSFIETQFPIARLSAESYKERKATNSQTLTGLGRWWGRKPLILVRAAILGMLMPASDNSKLDRAVFLKILTMDDDGAWQRNSKKKGSRSAFDALPYAQRLAACERPENIGGPTPAAWLEINAHLGTSATCLAELVQQLGERLYGHTPRVGDSFCGGGSIPFEAARIGCDAYGSDLNPVAGLLTWASLNILGGGKDVQEQIKRAQEAVFSAAERQIAEWGIERNDRGERAEAFLYCAEVKPEGCEYFIPLAPSWLVGESMSSIVRWHRVAGTERLQPEILIGSTDEVKLYKEKRGATIVDSRVIDPFDPNRSWSVEALRGSDGLRRWTNEDVVPRPGDVFQERLYCIRWVDGDGNRRYAVPDAADLEREATTFELLLERFSEWQRQGFIPSIPMPEGGEKTDEPIRTRGWTYWHHLFTPRQLLVNGLVAKIASESAQTRNEVAAFLLGIGRLANWNARLCRWHVRGIAIDKGEDVFSNQALNPLFNYSCRPLSALKFAWQLFNRISDIAVKGRSSIEVVDARDLRQCCDIWITDPPYADAVNYHELGDFFLAWYETQLAKGFPSWTPDARSELAVRGDGEEFRRSMVEIYQNLAENMPNNGMQMVMFTHQDPSVWADLGMILWAAGLKATAAWTISTETEAAGIKKGNYVQGTVCLVLRKRTSDEPGFLDEVYPLVEDEVKRQIASMQALDEGGEPNFNDADYQLAAYAAALKVLTRYATLDGRNVEDEVFASREKGQKSDFQGVIERALGIACDVLIPQGLGAVWRDLTLTERYYLRALDIESRGERRNGMYEELARGFGVTDIKPLLKTDKANGARMYTASSLGKSHLAPVGGQSADNSLVTRKGRSGSAPHPFAVSPLRHVLFAVKETSAGEGNPEPGRQYLRDSFGQNYWTLRERFVALLEWIVMVGNAAGMDDWRGDAESARILAGRLRNDHA